YNTHNSYNTVGDLFGSTEWTDPDDPDAVLAHSKFPSTWPEKYSFDSGEFDVVITDLGMPKLTGGQVAIGIRRHSSTTPIILLTGWGQQVDESQFEGVNLVLSKPPSDQSLEDALRKVLGM
ncbi:MAG: response regulator, partial [Planctomycetota bacterium]|nr:response regulator [Planctomycetota bacterium]